MNLVVKRHYSNLILKPHSSPTKQARILEFCKSGLLTEAIRVLNSTDSNEISPKPNLYASLLQTCTKVSSFGHGLQIHAHVVKSGLETDRFVGNSLLALYFKLGPDSTDTRRVFDGMFFKDAISWSSMVSRYVKCGEHAKALETFVEMLDFGLEPNAYTLSSAVVACSETGDVRLGRCFHGIVVTRGFEWNHVISSSLAVMYGGNGEPRDARRVFDEMPEPDAICWTSVVSSYTKNDMYEEAVEFFYVMHRRKGLAPDGYTFGTLLMACGNLGRIRQGREIHGKVTTSGMLCGNVVVQSSLLDMYGKCGFVKEARRVFDGMSEKNSVSWSALLGGYCQNGEHRMVIEMFREMEEKDLYCFGTVLRACAGLAAVRHGKEVHCQYIRRGGYKNVIVESALVDVYAKSGCDDFALRVFSKMSVRNLITWNTMLDGLSKNGRGEEAVMFFEVMVKEGIEPDYISFVGVLSACKHTGLVEEGRKYFALMADKYRIKPTAEIYGCMIDILGRAGLFEEAEDMLEKSEEFREDVHLWGVLLGPCAASGDASVVAERVGKRMMELEPKYHLSYVLLGNMYRAMGRHGDALEIRNLMDERGVGKTRGQSWIEAH
ncbi:PREDICTED: pentatricopeptide repeat-containing protein At1g03540 isoform X1 [Tarenaya hassleriana]|uniref:pentatricopeptide repeat-containing protein At1g03540 isoform X2 n=1 Tax=Tarenaya hassleriana TaxID=28532 RepID=UPI00053C7676|nr:PREDICTED: pentatricopeptide repeat-containing protein At1g03540 isoform X2 [Tarenaya hassleriana]XP_010556825.1 PREDICTED: pentatricopeptide repeat-containing protein At1g03540 isoform X1 [Tarenaya hassleriana]